MKLCLSLIGSNSFPIGATGAEILTPFGSVRFLALLTSYHEDVIWISTTGSPAIEQTWMNQVSKGGEQVEQGPPVHGLCIVPECQAVSSRLRGGSVDNAWRLSFGCLHCWRPLCMVRWSCDVMWVLCGLSWAWKELGHWRWPPSASDNLRWERSRRDPLWNMAAVTGSDPLEGV